MELHDLHDQIEKKELSIGFMALTDCAPLVIAKEMGFFDKWGLTVNLYKQNSWATLRDKLHAGILDAAQMLSPMPIASNYGLDCVKTKVVAPLVLSRNGNAITLSKSLYNCIKDQPIPYKQELPLSASFLKEVIATRKMLGNKVKLGAVFSYSCHYYQLISWLQGGGINPDDVDIVIIPPANMVMAMATGEIDGYCVGGPWNTMAVRQKVGFTGVTSLDIWPGTPEKVLGLLQDWQHEHPHTVQALIMALQEACEWLEIIPNRFEAARLLTTPHYLNTTLDNIAPSLLGSCLTFHDESPRSVPSYNQFSLFNDRVGNCPDTIDGEMLVKYMVQAGHVTDQNEPLLNVRDIFCSDLYHKTLERFSHRLADLESFEDITVLPIDDIKKAI
jgi:NitT/TauT family transport system ATP-binding protein/nitrate/nitrite transport system substrate-binding protein